MNTKRTFLQKSLSKGLECDMITAEDLLHHTSAEVLAHHLPNDLKAKLIKASLDAKEMSAELVVETLGTVAMAANLPPHTIWNCLAEAAERALGGTAIDIAPAELGESKSTSKPESASKSKSTKTTSSKSKPTTKAKPNAKVKVADKAETTDKSKTTGKAKTTDKAKTADKIPASLPGVPFVGAGSSDSAKMRAPTTPIIPRSEFDVDTDVGADVGDDEWDDVDDIVEVVEEADAVGAVALDDPALDWKSDEETAIKTGRRKR